MTDDKKTKFFFDDETEPQAADEPAAESFFTPDDPVLAKKASDAFSKGTTTGDQVVKEATMSELANSVLEVSFGPYQDNYGVHITPKHAKRNLATDRQVFLAIEKTMIIMNEYVPKALRVEIHPPRASWRMKVISFVVLKGATAWNFDTEKFEREGVPRIFEAVQKVILS
jgi:hypothetical protein